MIARLRQASAAALLVHVTKTLCALAAALPFAAAIPAPNPSVGPKVDALIVLLRLHDHVAEGQGRGALLPLLAALATAPFLLSVWLRATLQRDTLVAHAEAAAMRYRRACTLHFGGLLLQAALLGLAVAAAAYTDGAFPPERDARLRMLCSAGAGLPFALAAFHTLTLVDLAQLALVRGAALRASLRFARSASTLRLSVTRCLFAGAGLLILLASTSLPRLAFGIEANGLTLATGQLGALLVTMLRGAWLALLVAGLPHNEQRDPKYRAQLT